MVDLTGRAPATPSVETYTLEYTPEGAPTGTPPTPITLTIPSVDNDPNVLNFEESVELQRVLAEQLAVPASTIDLTKGMARLFTQDKMTEISLAPQGAHEAAIFSNDSAAAQAATQAMGASTTLADWRNIVDPNDGWVPITLDTFINTPLDFTASIQDLASFFERNNDSDSLIILIEFREELEKEARRSKKSEQEMLALIQELMHGGDPKMIMFQLVGISNRSQNSQLTFDKKMSAAHLNPINAAIRRTETQLAGTMREKASAATRRRGEKLRSKVDFLKQSRSSVLAEASMVDESIQSGNDQFNRLVDKLAQSSGTVFTG